MNKKVNNSNSLQMFLNFHNGNCLKIVDKKPLFSAYQNMWKNTEKNIKLRKRTTCFKRHYFCLTLMLNVKLACRCVQKIIVCA